VSGVIDTNVLLYAANSDAPEYGAAREFLLRVGYGSDPWYLTEGIVYEFLRVSTHAKVFAQPLEWRESLEFLRPLLEAENVLVLVAGASHWSLLETVLGEVTHPAGNLFFDVRTLVLMREHGIRRIFTADMDFLQFAEIEVVNPLRS